MKCRTSQKPVEYNGWTFKPVNIKGTTNSANILAACQAAECCTLSGVSPPTWFTGSARQTGRWEHRRFVPSAPRIVGGTLW